jgi:hypothetical protein
MYVSKIKIKNISIFHFFGKNNILIKEINLYAYNFIH